MKNFESAFWKFFLFYKFCLLLSFMVRLFKKSRGILIKSTKCCKDYNVAVFDACEYWHLVTFEGLEAFQDLFTIEQSFQMIKVVGPFQKIFKSSILYGLFYRKLWALGDLLKIHPFVLYLLHIITIFIKRKSTFTISQPLNSALSDNTPQLDFFFYPFFSFLSISTKKQTKQMKTFNDYPSSRATWNRRQTKICFSISRKMKKKTFSLHYTKNLRGSIQKAPLNLNSNCVFHFTWYFINFRWGNSIDFE